MKRASFRLTFPDVVTFLNVSLGFSSIVASALGRWDVAFALLLGAVVMDYLDGRFARALNAASDLGTHLDSLSDMVSFGVAPSFFLLSKSGFSPWVWGACVVLVCCGAFRLGRYNILHKAVKSGWVGMPITVNALILPIIGFLTSEVTIWVLVLLASSALMVSQIRFKRLF